MSFFYRTLTEKIKSDCSSDYSSHWQPNRLGRARIPIAKLYTCVSHKEALPLYQYITSGGRLITVMPTVIGSFKKL